MRSTNYTTAALRRATENIAAATMGARGRVTYNEAYGLGQLVGAGLLETPIVEEALLHAAQEAGLPMREALGHIRNGLRRGEERPRETLQQGHAAEPRHSRGSPSPPTYPPCEEVRTLWRHALPVTEDDEATAWFKGRGLNPEEVELSDLARVLPDRALPSWAACGRSWAATGHRLLLPAYTAAGTLASLRARALRDTDRKELAPTGYATHGLVLACPMARQLLTHGPPEWWTRSIVVAEGAPDFLTWATRQPERLEDGPAVFGVFSGSWTTALAARVPDGARIAIRTHADQTGEKYAAALAASLGGRCSLFRPHPLQPEGTA